jgi:hypothetical protein
LHDYGAHEPNGYPLTNCLRGVPKRESTWEGVQAIGCYVACHPN